MTTAGPNATTGAKASPRHALAAVQALYQIEHDAESRRRDVIDEFRARIA